MLSEAEASLPSQPPAQGYGILISPPQTPRREHQQPHCHAERSSSIPTLFSDAASPWDFDSDATREPDFHFRTRPQKNPPQPVTSNLVIHRLIMKSYL
jgi:hypothetical protein